MNLKPVLTSESPSVVVVQQVVRRVGEGAAKPLKQKPESLKQTFPKLSDKQMKGKHK